MKTLTRSAATVLGLVLGTVALGADDKKTDAKPISDAEFVMKAASGGLFEVESSKLAQTNGTSAEVKKFAEKMIADHGKANKELMEVATKAGQTVPTRMTDDDQKLLDKVKDAKGAAFDKTYVEAQVKAHENAVMLFENASKNLKDAGLKDFAAKTLPTLKEHHEMIKKHSAGGTKN